MHQVALSVSQLRCACVSPEWREDYLAGGKPSTFSFGSGVAVHGAAFHRIAEDFIDWALHPSYSREADQLDDESSIARKMQHLGGEELIEKLLHQGEVDSAALVGEAMFNFARRLVQLRQARRSFASWGEIFLSQEVTISNVLVYGGGEGAVFVSGKLDSLRIHPNGQLEIVDYKLSHGSEMEKELVQIAIYRKLLEQTRRGFRYRGCLEYFLPELVTQELDPDDLDAIYEKWVTPTLPLLLPQQQAKATPVTVPAATSLTPTPEPDAAKPPKEQKPPSSADSPSASGPSAATSASAHDTKPLCLGKGIGLASQPVTLDAEQLKRHSAFLGGAGSGKTTLALLLIEQLLERGIPAVLLDRKGDLCRYADPDAWATPPGAGPDAESPSRRKKLRDSLDIRLYTPGSPAGRELTINPVPDGIMDLPPYERDTLLKSSAAALGGMLNITKAGDPRIPILAQAFRLLTTHRPQERVSLQTLIEFIGSGDPSLQEAIGVIDKKHCAKLAENLQTFDLMQGHLLSGSASSSSTHRGAPAAEELNAELLLGRGQHAIPGQTRLSIVSTKFLGDKETTLFWVAQLLIELNRFASRNPSATLQGVLLFDEADMYLPAIAKPATKEPMENLLRRARSAGLGVMLATQSPGDLDYRCRENVLSWFIGRVQQPTALEKLRPLLQDSGIAQEKIASQSVGQFHFVDESGARPIKTDRNLVSTEQLPEERIVYLAHAQRS